MREMRWTWADLQDTPLDVRIGCWDLIQLERQAAAERADAQAAAGQGEQDAIRVAR